MIKSVVSATLFLAALTPSVAFAQEPAPTQIVRTSDLNLRSARGVAALDRRIEYAIEILCGTADNRDLDAQAGVRDCRAETQANMGTQRAAAIAAAKLDRASELASR